MSMADDDRKDEPGSYLNKAPSDRFKSRDLPERLRDYANALNMSGRDWNSRTLREAADEIEMWRKKDAETKAVCGHGVQPVRMAALPLDVPKQSMLKVAGTSFRCACGCNVSNRLTDALILAQHQNYELNKKIKYLAPVDWVPSEMMYQLTFRISSREMDVHYSGLLGTIVRARAEEMLTDLVTNHYGGRTRPINLDGEIRALRG